MNGCVRIVSDDEGGVRVLDSSGNPIPNVTKVRIRNSKTCGCLSATIELDKVYMDIKSMKPTIISPVFDPAKIDAMITNDVESWI